jgi:hypothetical protein
MARPVPDGMVNVVIEVNSRQVMDMLSKLNTSLDPTNVAVWMGATVHPWLEGRAKNRFSGEGDDVSGKWLPLKPATHKFRMNMQPPVPPEHPINVRTHELINYITGSPPSVVPHALGATLTFPGRKPFGELKKKVETAQAGRNQPATEARPVIGMNERDLLAVLTDLSLYISLGQFR